MSAKQKKHPFDFKTQYGLGFSTQDDEIVVDFFCGGGGGAGTGLALGPGGALPLLTAPRHEYVIPENVSRKLKLASIAKRCGSTAIPRATADAV
ncbi:hypothetical protein [Pseudomonas sp. RA_35y_Pfl2_P32]|uniref:hypothetical protein n=1 Tax=Pseudomonas sp. RA_35y_Pfl2_P32 TaxID=3088705 RepID=UPI0030D8B72B